MAKRLPVFLMVLVFCCVSLCAAAEGAWTCPDCGQEGNSQNFCTNCGAPRPAESGEWTCPSSGNEGNTQNFCPACGAKLAGEAKREESELRPVRCTSCGSGELKKVRAGEYRCTHCGTLFYTDGRRPGEEDEARDVKVAVLLSEAQAHAEKGDYQNELRTLAKAMELDPENDTVLLRLGRAYWRLGSVDKALEYFRRAEELYPGDPVVYVNIGSAFLKLGQYAEAKEQYERGIAIIEADPRSACAEDTAIAYGNYAL